MKKNKFKPAYIVDITDCVTASDVRAAIAIGKHNARIPLTDDELFDIVNKVVDFTNVIENAICAITYMFNNMCIKKEPWYKRMFKWFRK